MEPAGIRIRLAAAALDLLVLVLIFVLIEVILAWRTDNWPTQWDQVAGWFGNFWEICIAIPYNIGLMSVGEIPLWLLIVGFYWPPILGLAMYEMITGVTPGKKLTKLIVARADGKPAGLVRWVARGILKLSPVWLTALSSFCMINWLTYFEYKISLPLGNIDRFEFPVRYAGRIAAGAVFIGFLFSFGRRRQALYDRLCGTIVAPRHQPQNASGFDAVLSAASP